MKNKSRLIVMNIMIAAISAISIVGVLSYANWSSREIAHSYERQFPSEEEFTFRPEDRPDFREPRERVERLSNNLAFIVLIAALIIITAAIFLSNYVFQQVTKEAEEEKERQRTIYEDARKAMINGISHDLRTPLTVVKGNIKGIQDGITKTKEDEEKYLAAAYKRTLDIENLLARLFESFNYETGELRLERKMVNLNKFLEAAVNVIKSSPEIKADIKIVARKPRIMEKIDPVEFRRVIDNLISNAVKHNPAKKDLVIRIELDQTEKETVVKISDNGHGVREESLPHLFEEFFKEDSSRSKDSTSNGLGLFVAQQIVAAHGGTIEAKNENGLSVIIKIRRDKDV